MNRVTYFLLSNTLPRVARGSCIGLTSLTVYGSNMITNLEIPKEYNSNNSKKLKFKTINKCRLRKQIDLL